MENKSKELEVAIEAALEAGKIIEKYFNTEILKEFKEDTSIVTLADKETEEVIKKIILNHFPEHSVVGEESGVMGEHEYVWYIDPIDGTTNFSNGIPIFGISIALARNDELSLGVVYNPVINSLYYAEKGKGAYMNDIKISVSKDDKDHCLVTFGSGRQKDNKALSQQLIYSLPDKIRSVRILGSSALELSLVARGSIEAVYQIGLAAYDFAAGVLIAKEAGAKITDFKGEEWKFPGNHFLVSNGLFHNLLLEEIKIQKEKLGL